MASPHSATLGIAMHCMKRGLLGKIGDQIAGSLIDRTLMWPFREACGRLERDEHHIEAERWSKDGLEMV